MSRPRAALAGALIAAALGACGGASRGVRADPDAALLAFDCPVADAEVWIDGRYQAPCSQLTRGVRVAPGTHRVEVRHDDYHAFYGTIELAARERRRLAVELAEILR